MFTAESIEKFVWQQIENNYLSRNSEYHTPTLVYINQRGQLKADTIVLRKVLNPALYFHTDARSAKVSALQRARSAGFHFYSQLDKLQVYVVVDAVCHIGDAVTQMHWQASQPLSRQCYRTNRVPSAVYDGFLTECALPEDVAYQNFCVVECRVCSMEALWLSCKANERFFIDYEKQAFTRLNP